MTIYFYGINLQTQETRRLKPFPENKLKLRILKQMKSRGYFEGVQTFLIGAAKKTPFRIQELSNPARLIADFKH